MRILTKQEEEEIKENRQKLRAIREYCLENRETEDRFVNFGWILGHIMCIVKYGEGCSMEQYNSHTRTQ